MRLSMSLFPEQRTQYGKCHYCIDRRYINSELDELEREEYFRLKMVQNNKQRSAEKEGKQTETDNMDREEASDILVAQEDPDIIF